MNSERSCPWCGGAFARRQDGGSKRRFCSPSCRAMFHKKCRIWAVRAVDEGRLTMDAVKGGAASSVYAACRGIRVVWATPVAPKAQLHFSASISDPGRDLPSPFAEAGP